MELNIVSQTVMFFAAVEDGGMDFIVHFCKTSLQNLKRDIQNNLQELLKNLQTTFNEHILPRIFKKKEEEKVHKRRMSSYAGNYPGGRERLSSYSNGTNGIRPMLGGA